MFHDSQEIHDEKLLHESIQDMGLPFMVESELDPLGNVGPIKKGKYVVNSFSFASIYLVLLFSFLLVNGGCLIATTMNEAFVNMRG